MTNPCGDLQSLADRAVALGPEHGRTKELMGWAVCEIERLQKRLRVARNIIVDAQNFIHPTTVWRDTDLMQRNIDRFLADNPSAEPSGCPEHGMEHFFEGMCIKCGVVPAAKSGEPIICDRCGQDIAGKMIHECDGIL